MGLALELLAHARTQRRRGTHLNDLLLLALQAALSLCQRDDTAGAIAHTLHFDVTRALNELFHVSAAKESQTHAFFTALLTPPSATHTSPHANDRSASLAQAAAASTT
jgi:hypothetical protein